MPPRVWLARSLVPGIYADRDDRITLIHNERVGDRHFVVWAWFRKSSLPRLGEWTVHKLGPDDEFLDYKWERTIAFGQSK